MFAAGFLLEISPLAGRLSLGVSRLGPASRTSKRIRDLISERTKEGLIKARAKGRQLGLPKGALGRSKLDGKEDEIQALLQKQVSKTAIAKITGVSRTTLSHFIHTRKLVGD